MVRREIELDEESNQLLNELAEEYGGDAGRALTELLHSREGVEKFLDISEAEQSGVLRTQKARAERGSRESFTVWEEIKRRHNL
jgi:hypothetical protein